MLSIVLSALISQIVTGDKVCFDIEASNTDVFSTMSMFDTDDEVHEDTTCKICAWQYQGSSTVSECKNGIKNGGGSNNISDVACIDFDSNTLQEDVDLYISTDCSDALWIDRLYVEGSDSSSSSSSEEADWSFWRGTNNDNGFCLSEDRNDHLDWNNDDAAQHVDDGQCFYQLKFTSSGKVYGTHDGKQDKLCRSEKKMNCKEGCESGWKHVSTSDHGCCKNFLSCGGNRKTCQIDEPCRRRTEEADNVRMLGSGLEAEEAKNWVELTPAQHALMAPVETPAGRLAERLSQASAMKEEVQSAISSLEKLLGEIEAGTAN